MPAYSCAQMAAVAAPPPPPPPRPADTTHVLQALAELSRGDGDYLGTTQFQAPGCMRLVLDFEAATVQAPAAVVGEGGSEARGRFLARLLHATMRQNADWLAGVVAAPPRQQYHRLSSIHALPRRCAEAQRSFVAAVQSQSVSVQVADHEFAVPVRAVLGHLPADHCRLVVKGLPPNYAISGVTEALLQAAGYGSDSSVAVVHERAGLLSAAGLVGEEGEFSVPVLDTVVAVVLVPRACAGLPMLPRTLAGSGWEASIVVEEGIVPTGQLVLRQAATVPPAASLPPVMHPGVRPGMARVYASGGMTSVAGTSVAAAGAGKTPGDRTGLGFGPAAAAGGASAAAPVEPAPPGVAPQPPPPPQEPMPPAEPAPSVPMDEPGFDAACELVGDALDGCTVGEVQQVVLQARSVAPSAYAEAAQVTTSSSLPRAFRAALHAQAQVLLGAQRAGPLVVPEPVDMEGLPGSADELLGLPLPGAAAGSSRAAVGGVAPPPAPAVVVGAGASPPPAPGRRHTRSTTSPGGQSSTTTSWLELQQRSMGGTNTTPSSGQGKARGRGAV